MAELDEFQELLKQLMGGMPVDIEPSTQGVQLIFSQIPPAMRQMFQEQYADLL